MAEQHIDEIAPGAGTAGYFATIDLGTNNCRMMIAKPAATGFEVVDGYSRIVRLGEGVVTSNRLNDDAMGRTLNALRTCATKMKAWGVANIRCIATEACRRAENGEAFLKRVEQETGLLFEIVTPELEAHLTLHGCMPLFVADKPKTLLFDIGGGSTEIVWAEMLTPQSPKLLGVLSFPKGVVTLAETYRNDEADTETFARICADVSEILKPFGRQHGIADAIAADQIQMIGTSGTLTTLGALALNLERYDRRQVDGLEISFQTIEALVNQIVGMTMEARQAVPCIGRDRADLMLMGCAILTAICQLWPVGQLRAADRGIREGLLMEMIEKDRQKNVFADTLNNDTPSPTYAR